MHVLTGTFVGERETATGGFNVRMSLDRRLATERLFMEDVNVCWRKRNSAVKDQALVASLIRVCEGVLAAERGHFGAEFEGLGEPTD